MLNRWGKLWGVFGMFFFFSVDSIALGQNVAVLKAELKGVEGRLDAKTDGAKNELTTSINGVKSEFNTSIKWIISGIGAVLLVFLGFLALLLNFYVKKVLPNMVQRERFRYIFALLILLHTSLAIAAPQYYPEAARLYDVGLRALSHGAQAEAQTALEKAVTLDPGLSDAHCVLGLIYSGFEEFRAAADAFQRATLADENYIEAYCELGDVLLVQLAEPEQAIHALRKAVEMDANHARARTLLGIAYFRENLTDAAIRELQLAIDLDPTSRTARYTLGTTLLQKEEWTSAINTFKKLIEIDPFYAKAHFSLGTAYRRIGKIAEAQETLQRFETLSVEEDQLTHLKRFVRQSPTNAKAWYQLGRLQMKRQLWQEATQALERYVTLAPKETRGAEALGYLHFQQQNYKQAVAMYRKVIQQKPHVATYRNSLGGAYLMLAQYAEAIEQYQTAIHLKPFEPRFYLNLSKAYQLTGADAKSEKTYQEYERLTSKFK